jgi:hypothetical protein
VIGCADFIELSEELRHQKGAYNGNSDESHNSGDLKPSPFCLATLKDAATCQRAIENVNGGSDWIAEARFESLPPTLRRDANLH